MHLRTKFQLAKKTGVSRVTLDRYLAMPGAPVSVKGKGWPVELVLDWIAANADSESTAAKSSDEIRSLKAREIFLRCERMKFHLERDKGKYILAEPLLMGMRKFLMAQRNIIWRRWVIEFPCKCEQMSIPEVREQADKMFNYTVRDLRETLSLFEDAEHEFLAKEQHNKHENKQNEKAIQTNKANEDPHPASGAPIGLPEEVHASGAEILHKPRPENRGLLHADPHQQKGSGMGGQPLGEGESETSTGRS